MTAIYCQEKTPRIQFIFELIFGDLLGMKFELTDDLDAYMAAKGMKICYSEVEIDGFWIQSSTLLFEKELRKVDFHFDFDEDHFLLNGEDFFDPMAASFYLVSRYEEYLAFEADEHGRFPATESILYKYQQLKRPLVNLWAIELKHALTDYYPNLLLNPREFEFISSIDIDQAFKYRHKGWTRNIGGLVRDALKGDWQLVKERIAILRGKQKDPFDNFAWQEKIHLKKNTKVQYFIQVGNYGEYDKNLSLDIHDFRDIVKGLDQNHSLGIHPSYASNDKLEMVGVEKARLEAVVGHGITVSRQHFLKMQLPETFKTLIKNGITEDHSLGYSTHLGFRAGIAAPFYFFDLSTNEQTELRLVPFCMMDITPLHYYEQTPAEAKIELTLMIDGLKKCGGLCVSLWHNESFSENQRWQGWRTVYEHILNQSVKN
jgi:hypothetical protein